MLFSCIEGVHHRIKGKKYINIKNIGIKTHTPGANIQTSSGAELNKIPHLKIKPLLGTFPYSKLIAYR